MSVHAVLYDRHSEHLRCAGAVDVLAFLEGLLAPCFPRQPGCHSCLDGRVVCNYESVAFRWYDGRSDQCAEDVVKASVQKLRHFPFLVLDQFPGSVEVIECVPREVLRLDQSACKASGSASVELEASADPAVSAGAALEAVILLYARLAELLSDFQGAPCLWRDVLLQQLSHRCLVQALYCMAFLPFDPAFQL